MSTTFLRRLAAFACAALVSTPFAAPSAGQPATPSAQQGPAPVRLALVGAWHVHTSGFLNRIAQMNPGQVEWMAVWDQDATRGRQFAERLGVVFQPDYQTILDDPRVDAVMIEAETNLHLDLILRAAQARKHIFTDKILTPRVADALRIRDAVDRAGVKFVISHESMPLGSYQYARRLVTEGRLGEIVSVHFRRAHGMAKGNGLPASWWDPAVAGGGALIDLGVHGMGLLTYLAGPPARVTASMRHRTGRTLEDTATILVDFENGAIGTAHTNMVTNTQENLLEVVGTDGMLVVVGTEGRETVYLNSKHIPERSKGMTVVPPAEYAGDGKYPINKFIDFVRDRANTAQYLTGTGLDIETALRVVAISEAAYESARRDGQPQVVPGIPRATTPAPGPSATGDLPAARTPLQALPPFAMVESDRHGTNRQWKIDVHRVAIDGSNRAERITFFQSGNTPYHGSNPVVSPDGKWAAVQLGIHGMGAGQGRGLVLVDLAAWERHHREGRLKPPPAEREAVRPSGR